MKTITLAGTPITPSKIICIGRNYVDHIAELGNEVPDEMVVFNKPNSAISEYLHAFHLEPLSYEGELCFVYQANKFSAVGFGLDLTKRGLQNQLKSKGLPWERAKGFDGAAVFSDFVAIESIDSALTLQLTINGKVMQTGGIELMMYQPEKILEQLQTFISLEEGDIVMTGTPKGVGLIKAGDKFEGKVVLHDKTLVKGDWLAR